MKALLAAGALIASATGLVALAVAPPTTQPAGPRVPVLAELFTSEGCSSCPPADDVLRRLVADQPIEGVEVVGLGEHVDYWDRLGWKDPFSSAQFTARQQAYARVFGADRIYTPQLVVDGRTELVGSDAGAARRAMMNAARAPRAIVDVSGAVAANTASIHVAVRDVPKGTNTSGLAVFTAIVEDDLASDVTRGENARRRLRHTAVTRLIDTIGTLEAGATAGEFSRKVAVDGAWRRDHLRAIAFLQDSRTLHVVGTASVPLRRE